MMSNKITRRQFLAAAGTVAAAGALSACGAASSPAASTAGSAAAASSAAADSDWAVIQGKGTLVIGVTQYAPMDYFAEDGSTWIGFDADMARAVCEKLGVEAVFQEIEWDNKVFELEAGNIDCVWNGMTVTEELAESMDFSTSYAVNMQVCVVRQSDAETYATLEDINAAGVQIGAESGSAGEDAAQENFPNATLTGVNAQRDCLLELKSGTLDVGVIDYVMALDQTGEGTSYSDLTIVDGLELSKEEFAVGLRKGSDVTAMIDAAFAELAADGTVDELSAQYGVANTL